MPQFRLIAQVTVSAHTVVEAESLEEAVAIASRRPVEFASDGYATSDYWLIDEADGSPQRIEEDKE